MNGPMVARIEVLSRLHATFCAYEIYDSLACTLGFKLLTLMSAVVRVRVCETDDWFHYPETRLTNTAHSTIPSIDLFPDMCQRTGLVKLPLQTHLVLVETAALVPIV